VRAVTGEDKGALLVPQPAVTELQGGYEVVVVGGDNRVATRQVQVGERVGTMWVIASGLKPGDRVVVEGQQKVRSGMRVQPTPYHAAS
jgi:multidrug efflux pump subunit AcrA (membrane-fusion protein)